MDDVVLDEDEVVVSLVEDEVVDCVEDVEVVVTLEDDEVVEVVDEEDVEVFVCEEEVVVCEVVEVVDFEVLELVVSPPSLQAEKARIATNRRVAINPSFLFFINLLPFFSSCKNIIDFLNLNHKQP